MAVLRIINDKPEGYIAQSTLPLVRDNMCKFHIHANTYEKNDLL